MNIDIDAQTQIHLNEIASRCNRSPEELASEILTQHIQDQKQAFYWKERSEDMETLEAMKKGHFITQEDMFKKIDGMIEKAKILEK